MELSNYLNFFTGGVSFVGCGWLLSEYAHTHPDRKVFPLKMVLILSLTTFFQSCTMLIIPFFGMTLDDCKSIRFISLSFMIFSIMWSGVLALFIGKYGYNSQAIEGKNLVLKLFMLCLIACLAFPWMYSLYFSSFY